MKRLLGFIPLLGMLLVSCVSFSSVSYDKGKAYKTVPADKGTLHFREYKNGFFIAEYDESIVLYRLPSDKWSKFRGAPNLRYKEFGSYIETEPVAEFSRDSKIKVNGEIVPYSIKHLDPGNNEDTSRVRIEISVGDMSWQYEYKVETLPVSKGMTYDEVIKILGYPNDERKYITSTWSGRYPNYRSPERFLHIWTIEYDKYPKCSFHFDDSGKLSFVSLIEGLSKVGVSD